MCDNITNGCGGGGGGTTTVVNSPVSVVISSGSGGNGTSVGNTLTLDVLTARLINSNGLGTFNLANANFFSGDGSNVANLNASSISSGTVNSAYLEQTGVLAALYGGDANVPQLVIDQWGRVSNAVNVQTQWTPTGLFNIATANGVSIGTLNDPPTGSNLYVLGTANVTTMNVNNLFANTVTIFGLNTLNVYGTSNMNAVYASNYFGNASTLKSINASNLVGNVASANLSLIVTGAAQPNITSVGVLTNLVVQGQVTISNGSAISNINGANVFGNVANSTVALVVSQAAQPNITSVGTLTGLAVNGLLIASNGFAISNLNSSNLTGNVANANVALVVSQASQPNITSVGTLTGLKVSGLLTASNGSGISNIAGSNVTGNVANSTVSLVVSGNTQSNITSVGTLVSLDVSGQISGDGYNITNLNPANITGTVRTAASVTTAGQPNITSVGILSNLVVQGLATISNGSAISNLNSSNIFGTVYAAQVVTQNAQPNITSVGVLSGLTVSNLLIASNASGLANLNASNLVGNVANSNVALVVSQASQPNITSVGTLTGLNVQGLLIASDGSGIANLRAANITGTVATAGVVTNPAQVNITSVGTLTSLGVTGIITGGLFSGNGSALSNINASNVIGDVPLADSVLNPAQPNITSVGLLSNLAVSNSVTTGNVWANSLSVTGLSGQNPVKFVSDSGTFFMASSGRIGINMTTPSSQLEIGATGGATAIAINLSDSSVGAGNGVSLTKDAGQNMILASQNLADAWIVNYGTTRFRMYSTTGQSLLAPIYIGPTITPPPSISTTLYVLGNAYISNTVTTTNIYVSGANISQLSVTTLANITSANAVTLNTASANVTTANLSSLNVFTGANITQLSVTAFANILSANIQTINSASANLTTENVGSLNVFTGANITQLSVTTLANILSANAVTLNTASANVTSGNVGSLNVFTGANITQLSVTTLANILSANIVTANHASLNVTTENVGSLNVFTGANITQLSVTTLANILSANILTSNHASLNVTYGNVGSLNVFTGANVTQLTVSGLSNLFSANAVTLNTASANVTSGNVGSLNVFTGANITTLTSPLANIATLNTASANVTTANLGSLNVFTGANITQLSVTTLANILSANIQTINSASANLTTENVGSLNVFTGANITQLSVTTLANILSANAVTMNTASANVTSGNVGSLNVFTGANVTQLTVSGLSNLFSANAVTLNTASANVTSGNIGSLNVFTGANITQLSVTTLANILSANVQTINSASANLTTENVGSLNVFTGANITTLTSPLANIATLNTALANVTTANLGSLNVFTGANVTQLTVSGLSNLFSANAVTLNTASANVTSGNVGSLNVFTGANITQLSVTTLANILSANIVTANHASLNVTTENVGSLNVFTGANITQLSVTTLANILSANIQTLNSASANLTTENVGSLNVFTGANVTQLSVTTLANVTLLNVSTTANVTNLTVTSNIVPAGTSGNTYLTGNIIVSGNVFSSVGSPLGAGGGYYFSLPSDITLQTPYTGAIYGTTYPLSVGLSNGFTINGTSTLISVTTNGNFKFVVAGAYIISAVFLGSDNLTGLALGSNAADVHGTDQGYLYRYTTQITQNPTELIEIPFNVTDVSKYYYLDLFATASGTLKATTSSSGGTYLTITPLQGGGLATGGPGGTPGTQWISSGSNIYFPNSVGIGAVNPQYNLDVSTGNTATQTLITSNISSLGLYGPILNVASNVLIQSNLAVGGSSTPLVSPPYTLYVTGQGYFSQHVSYANFAGYRNRLVNGTFRVAYRANTITVSNTSTFTSNGWVVDRWRVDVGGLSTSNVSMIVKQDAPVGTTNGFTQCANVYVSRALTGTTGNTWVCPLSQTIEASFIFDFRWGQASGKSAVFSFYANVLVSGDYSVVFRSRQDNTYFANLVSITAGTWQTKYVYLPACLIGNWAQSATDGYLDVLIGGVSYGVNSSNNRAVAVTSSWTANPGFAPVSCIGATKWPATTGLVLQITGPQLEEGTISTPFEVRPLTQTLIYCQRFFETNPDIQYASALGSGRVNSVPFVVTKRNNANVLVYRDLSNLTANTNVSQFVAYYGNGTLVGTQAINSYIGSEYGFSFNFTNTGSKFMDASIMEAQFVWKADAEIY
jgi:hypothetical protein